MQKHVLEKSKLFPLFAWTLIIGFAVFVSSLIFELRHTINEIDAIKQNNSVVTPDSNISL